MASTGDRLALPVSFMRGGTSRGLFFREEDLPRDCAERRRALLGAIGSPDPNGRQLDGMGGGISSLSKVMTVRRSDRPGMDVDYLFGQVAVDRPEIDERGNCGNLSSAVGVFAVEQGLVSLPDGPGVVRMWNLNTSKRIDCHLTVRGGLPAVTGDAAIEGVAGTGSAIRLAFVEPGGAATGRLLPTGNVRDRLVLADGTGVEASLVDAANPCIFVPAAQLGLTGTERPEEIDADRTLMARLEEIRTRLAIAAGMAAAAGEVPASVPKIAIAGPAAPWRTLSGAGRDAGAADLHIRMISMGRAHLAIPLTGALAASVAARIAGSVLHDLTGPQPEGQVLRIGQASGTVEVLGAVRRDGAGWHADSASVLRTARTLMQGQVFVPASAMTAPAAGMAAE